MGELVRVVGGTHRGADGEVYEDGDVFEASESELEAFGDKLERVEEDSTGGYSAVEASDQPDEAGEHRLVSGTHRKVVDGVERVFEEGDVVELTDDEVEAFGDKFERVDTGDSDGAENGADSGESSSSDSATESSEKPDAETSADASGEGVDENSEADAETETPNIVDGIVLLDDADEYDFPEGFPDEIPDADAWDWDALREVSKANDVDASQSKPDQVDDLRSKRAS